jgi:hypothetical protein
MVRYGRVWYGGYATVRYGMLRYFVVCTLSGLEARLVLYRVRLCVHYSAGLGILRLSGGHQTGGLNHKE